MSESQDHKIILSTAEDSEDDMVFDVRQNTLAMRSNQSEFWQNLRDQFRAKGISPENGILVELVPCGGSCEIDQEDGPMSNISITEEYGYLIDEKSNVYEFELSGGAISKWKDITAQRHSSSYSKEIMIGYSLLQKGI